MVVFIDALGWEVLRGRTFMEEELPHRRKLRSVFGYSSACVPSILTGNWPRDHGHWSFFFYSPETSPFRLLRWLRLFPARIIDRGRVRNWISKLVKRLYGFTGYFQFSQLAKDGWQLTATTLGRYTRTQRRIKRNETDGILLRDH